MNPFDQLDTVLTPAEKAGLDNQPMPSFMERFRANESQAWYTGTLAGAMKGTITEPGSGPFNQQARAQALSAYDAMPQWETPLDGLAAFSGQLWGSVQSPETMIGEIGAGAKALETAGIKSASWMARFFTGAIDAGIVNAGTDVAVQSIEATHGNRQSYDPTQTAIAAGLGGIIGGALHSAGAPLSNAMRHLLGRATPDVAPVPEAKPLEALAPAPAVEPAKAANAIPEPSQAAAAPLPEPPALGDALDQAAREVRGLPVRPVEPPAAVAALGPRPTDAAGQLAWDIRFVAQHPGGEKAILQNIDTWKQAKPEDPNFAVYQDNLKTVAQVSPDLLTPKAPEVLASLAQGPHAGQLARDVAGVAATPEQVKEPAQFTRLKETADALVQSLDAVAVRLGRIAQRKAEGIYKVGSGVIRLKKPDDFNVLAHELGHHVEVNIGTDVTSLMAKHQGELTPMAYQGAKPGTELKEGFAEFMRTMVTNPAYASQHAPQFDAQFRAMLQAKHPEVLTAIEKAAGAWRQWLEQPSATAVASTIVSSKQPTWFPKLRKELAQFGLGDTIAERISGFYTGALDELNPLARATRALAEVFKANNKKLIDLPAAHDPYKLARLLPAAYQAGHMDIMHGVVPYHGSAPASSSLRDAIVMALGGANALSKWDETRLQQFGSYLWSRRAIGEWERFDAGLIPNPPDKLTRGDHAQNIKDLEAQFPAFAEAAPMVHDFAQSLWTKKRDAGLITQEQWQAGRAIKDYVPGLRAFDQAGDAVGVGGKKADSAKAGFVKRFKGSSRDVLNPIESLMQDAYQTARAIAQNDMVVALDRLATLAGPGSGRVAERIPSHELKAMNLNIADVSGQILDSLDVSEPDKQMFRDALMEHVGDGKLTYFRPSVINDKGEAIAFFREGGELKALRLADGQFGKDMARAMTVMNNRESNVFVNLASVSSSILRLGVTASPDFLLANAIRDLTTSAIFYGKPLKIVKGMISGAADEVFQRDAARAYNAAGGIMGGAEVAGLRDARLRVDINALRKKGWVAERFTSFKGLMEASALSETGMRIGLFKDFFDAAKGRGLSDYEAAVEAAFQARDHIDFDRRGSQMMAVARLVPFLNASLQGLDKAWRQMIQPLTSKALTETERRAKGEAAKAWARISALTVATMGLHALMSQHDSYNDFSPQTKATHWVIKWGDKWLVVPKPFELGAVLNAGVAAWDAMVRRDPRWAEQYLQGLYEVAMPPNALQGNPSIAAAYSTMSGNDLRSGQPIVPDQLAGLEPWLQYDHTTSDMFKAIGKATGKSPIFWQYVFTQHTGSLGRMATSMYDYALSDKPLQGWDDFAFTRRFIKDASRGASSVRAFWDLVGQRNGQLEGSRKSWQAMVDAGDTVAASDYLAKQDAATKAWIAAGSAKADIRRLHPFMRARSAVSAINDLRRDMVQASIQTSDGMITVNAQDRGAADDILEKLAMTEARNALVMMKIPGWQDRAVMETAGYYRELQSLSPPLAKALADRFATAKVLPLDAVEQLWPEAQQRLLSDGSAMKDWDLVAKAQAAGFEMDGTAIKRKPRAQVPGQ
jgi:hypothetical protein